MSLREVQSERSSSERFPSWHSRASSAVHPVRSRLSSMYPVMSFALRVLRDEHPLTLISRIGLWSHLTSVRLVMPLRSRVPLMLL